MKRYTQSNSAITPNIIRLAVIACIEDYLDDFYSVIDETDSSWEIEVEQEDDLEPFAEQLYDYVQERINECSELEEFQTSGFYPAYRFTVRNVVTVECYYNMYENLTTFAVKVD